VLAADTVLAQVLAFPGSARLRDCGVESRCRAFSCAAR